MKTGSMAVLVALCLSQAPVAHAQIGAIISIIGGSLTAGKGQQDKEQRERDAEAWRQEKEAEREENFQRREAARVADIERQRAAAAEAYRLAEERAIAVRTGKIKASTIEDLQTLYDPDDGWDIAQSPKLKADRERYIISGTIARAESDAMFICQTVPGKDEFIGNYFGVRISGKTKKERDILERMRINGRLFVVGRYTANRKYFTVGGEQKVMPFFDADHIVVPVDGD